MSEQTVTATVQTALTARKISAPIDQLKLAELVTVANGTKTAQELANELGAKVATFRQALSSVSKKLAKVGITLPALRDGRTGRTGSRSVSGEQLAAAIAALKAE